MAHRIASRAEADLDEIWLYVARESGSIEIANRAIDRITDCFLMLAKFPRIGRPREDFGLGCRSLAVGQYLIVYCIEDEGALILRVLHARRDIQTLLGR